MMGRPRKPDKKQVIAVSLSPEELTMLMEIMDASGLSKSSVVGLAIREYFKELISGN